MPSRVFKERVFPGRDVTHAQIVKELHGHLRNTKASGRAYWEGVAPGFAVDRFLALPEEVRYDRALAKKALENAMPKIKESLVVYATAHNENNPEKWADREVKNIPKFTSLSGGKGGFGSASTHLIGLTFGYVGAFLEAVNMEGTGYMQHHSYNRWEPHNFDSPHLTITATHYLLEYHKLLEKELKKRG